MGLLKDRPPRVTLYSSGIRRRVTPVARVPLTVRALDDFGLMDLAIQLQTTGGTSETQESQRIEVATLASSPREADQTQVEREQTVPLAECVLEPGSVVRRTGIATDNCAQGSQQGVSRALTLQVVKADELLYEILVRQRAQRAKFQEALAQSQAQQQTLSGPLTDESRSGLQRRHQVIARNVRQIAAQLEASLTELSINELSSPEARELLKEIAAPGGADSAHGGSDVPAEAPEAADAAEATSQRHETMPDAGQTHEADSSGRSLDAGSGGRAQFAAMPAGVADSGGELTLVAAKPGDAMSGESHESPDTRTERRGAPTTRTPLRRRASKPRRPTRESQSWSASPTAPGNVSPPSLACVTRVAPSPKAVATQVIVS